MDSSKAPKVVTSSSLRSARGHGSWASAAPSPAGPTAESGAWMQIWVISWVMYTIVHIGHVVYRDSLDMIYNKVKGLAGCCHDQTMSHVQHG